MHLAYVTTLVIKGFDGAIEVLSGLIILLTGPQRIYRWVVRVTAPELYDGSHVAAVHAIRRGAQHLATSGAHFVEFYLVVHGLLGPGVAGSTRFDPQAKALGEWLRSRVVDIPEALR